MRSITRKVAALAAAAGLVVGIAGVAGADGIIAGESDDVATSGDLPMGEVCRTDGTDGFNGGNDQEAFAWLNRAQKADGNKSHEVWAEEEAVTITATESHANISTEVEAPGTLTIPTDWTDDHNHDPLGPLGVTIHIEDAPLGVLVGEGPGEGNDRKVAIGASGLSVEGTTWAPPADDVQVSATIVDSDTAVSQDCFKPLISIDTPAAQTPPVEIEQSSTVASDFECTDLESDHALNTGVESCTGVVTDPDDNDSSAAESPFNLPTTTLGVHTLVVTAVDDAGNVETSSSTYEVVSVASVTYAASFKQPIDGSGTINIAKVGRVIPVKAEILGDDVPQSEIESGEGPVSMQAVALSCDGSGQGDSVESYAAGNSNLGNQFRWDSTGGFWIYNLDTSKLPAAAANKCYTLKVYLGGTAGTDNVVNGGTFVGSFLIKLTK